MIRNSRNNTGDQGNDGDDNDNDDGDAHKNSNINTENHMEGALIPRNFRGENAETIIKSHENVHGGHGMNQSVCDDDSTTATVVSLLESLSSTATATAKTPLNTSMQHHKINGKAKQRLDGLNDWDHASSKVIRGGGKQAGEEEVLDPRFKRSMQFLQHPSISSLSSLEKESFLRSKGLSSNGIKIAKEASAKSFNVGNPTTTPDTDAANTTDDGISDSGSDDSDDSDTINSDDYLELSKRNTRYRCALNKGKDTERGFDLHTPLSSRKDSVFDKHPDRSTSIIKIPERKMRKRGINRIMYRGQGPTSCVSSRGNEDRTRELCPLNDDGCNHINFHPCIHLVNEKQSHQELPVLPTNPLSFYPFTKNVMGKFIIMITVLFGVIIVVILLVCQWSTDGDYFMFFPPILTITDYDVSQIIDNRQNIKFDEKNINLLFDNMIDENTEIEEMRKDAYFIVPAPSTIITTAQVWDSFVQNVGKPFCDGVEESYDNQQDERLFICTKGESMTNAPFLLREQMYKDTEHAYEVQEKNKDSNGYSSDKTSNDVNIAERMRDLGKKDHDVKIPKNDEQSVLRLHRQNIQISRNSHRFVKPIKKILYANGRLSTQKVDLWNQGNLRLTVDEEIGRIRIRKESAHITNMQKITSHMKIIAQLTLLKSTLESLKGELVIQSCPGDLYNKQKQKDIRGDDICDKGIFRSCSDVKTVLNKLESISTTIFTIDSTVRQERSLSKCGGSEYVHTEPAHRQQTDQNITSECSTQICNRDGYSKFNTNIFHQFTKTNTDEHHKTVISRLLGKARQITGRIISNIRTGLKLILRICWLW